MRWDELSWPQLDALDRDLPIMVPLGSCEQHGPHLPTFVDTIQVSEIARRVEAQLASQIVVVPTQWLGSSHHHRDFPGTISLKPTQYVSVIQEIARSILRAGFRRIFFLNGHGGNIAPAATALVDLIADDDEADSAHLALSSWWRVASEGLRSELIGVSQAVMAHACAYETSLMLAIRPELVDRSKITARPDPALHDAWFHSEDDSRQRVTVFHRFSRYTTDGVLGKSPEASAEQGAIILEAAVRDVSAFLHDFARWPMLPRRRAPNTRPSPD